MKRLVLAAIVLGFLFFIGCSGQNKIRSSTPAISGQWIDKNLHDAGNQYKFLATKVPEGVMPRSFTNDSLRTCTSENWVAGFYPGTLFYLYENTKDQAFYVEALRSRFLFHHPSC